MKKILHPIVYTMILTLNLSLLSAPAQAALISAESVAQHNTRANQEQIVERTLSQSAVVDQLTAMGVDPAEARKRVSALTDQELAALSGKIEQLPAGGDFVGTVGAIFIILLITDILGFTKVFPFTRAQR